ncbi:MAG: serine/threonine-protein kinase, partial [Myxococcota bacterium]
MSDDSDETLDVPGVYRDEDFLPAGAPVGRYVILSTLGVGGMGIVYSAYDPELDRKVAIKVLRRSADSDEYQELLMREAKSMARVSHQNVASIFDVGTVDGNVFLAMEHIDGLTLKDWSALAVRSEEEIVNAMVAAGRGLSAAHRAGVVHRDFKPANVLVGTDGRVVVTDFGIAHAVADGELSAGIRSSKVGTPAYMAPETLKGATSDSRSDQFSFAVTLYELLYGEHPYGGRGDGIARAIVGGELKERARDSKVSARVHSVAVRGLSHAPGDRFDSMDDLLANLVDDPQRRQRRWIGIGAIAAVVLLAFSTLLLRKDNACDGYRKRVDEVWSGPVKARVEKAFMESSVPFAQQAFELTGRALGAYGDAWVEMQTSSCEAAG